MLKEISKKEINARLSTDETLIEESEERFLEEEIDGESKFFFAK